jgi:phosphoribosylamine--glycine ligase
VTSGGRVLGITAFAEDRTVRDLIDDAYRAVSAISFDAMHFRTDIGKRSTMHITTTQTSSRERR